MIISDLPVNTAPWRPWRPESFKKSDFEFAAQASAVALKAGASADAAYEKGVAVYTMTKGGLMYEASIGGQKFKYFPEDHSE